MSILVIVEHNNQKVSPSTWSTIAATRYLNTTLDVMIVGYHCDAVLSECKKIPNVKKILLVDSIDYEYQLVENTAKLIAEVASPYRFVLVPATTFGKNLLPRVAALCDSEMISDVVTILSSNQFQRFIYAGNILATIESSEPIVFLSIRPSVFPPILLDENENSSEVIRLVKHYSNTWSSLIERKLSESGRPELSNAKIVVAGGRGLKSKENFLLLEELANRLGAALGASRAAVDAGFISNDHQVGQTGKIVAPDLYIAIGISGAIQHLAGMKESKTVVAINKDPEAPICGEADYIWNEDLFKAIQDLNNVLKEEDLRCN